MKLLYLDESGDEGGPPPYGKSATSHFIIGGAIVDADNAKAVQSRLNERWQEVKKEVPQTSPWKPGPRMSALPYFHMTDILAGREYPWDQLPEDRRKQVIQSLIEDVLDLGIRLTGDVLDKKAHIDRAAGKFTPWRPFTFTVANQLGRYQLALAPDEHGIVIMDMYHQKRQNEIRQDYERWVLRGTTLSGNPDYPAKKLDNVIDVIMFSPSRFAPGLQLADLAASILFQKWVRGKDEFYNASKEAWKRPDGKFDPSIQPL